MLPSTDLIMYFNQLKLYVILKIEEHIFLIHFSLFDDGILSIEFSYYKYLLLSYNFKLFITN